MSIVVRLRTTADAARIGEVTPPAALFIDAADEIDRLKADNLRWSKVADERSMQNTALRQENERLRAENTNLRASMDSIRAIVLAARDLEQTVREENHD